jgi:hypothetical protein
MGIKMTRELKAKVDLELEKCERADGAVAGVVRELTQQLSSRIIQTCERDFSHMTSTDPQAWADDFRALRRAVTEVGLDTRDLMGEMARNNSQVSKGRLLRTVAHLKTRLEEIQKTVTDKRLLIND